MSASNTEGNPVSFFLDGSDGGVMRINMTSNLIQAFEFNENPIRVFGTPENPLFVATDVCQVLDLGNPTRALSSLEEDEKITLTNSKGNPRAGIPHQLAVVTEPGLYSLITKSRKEEAKAFNRWVFHEVLPTIRKTGQYQIKELSRREILELALEAERKAEKLALENTALSEDVERMRPKEELFDVAMASRSTILIRDAAKLLNEKIPGGLGEKRLYAWMRANKWLYGENKPYQDKIDAGYLKLTEFPVPTRSHGTIIRTTVRVTQKGLNALLRKLTSPPDSLAA